MESSPTKEVECRFQREYDGVTWQKTVTLWPHEAKVWFTLKNTENVLTPNAWSLVVQTPNPAIDTGVLVPGFNDDYQGTSPDIGAFENGNPALRFGREAASGFARAPWERY